MDETTRAVHSKLKELRTREDLTLKPTPLLKPTFTDFSGEERPLKIRYYQVQGILHLMAMNRFLLGDDTGLGKCVVGDTLVHTNRGLLPIADLNPGITRPDTDAPLEGIRVEIGGESLPVTRFYYGGSKPTIKVRTWGGYEVEGSRVHPMLVRREGVEQWVKLQDVRKGDFLAVERLPAMTLHEGREEPSLPGGHAQPSKMSPALARLLGYLSTEDHEHASPEALADMGALSKELFGERGFRGESGLRFLRDVGCRVDGADAVPWSVLQGSPSSQREFLRGYFDVAGTCVEDGISVLSASENLLRQVQVMLLSFGVVSRRWRGQEVWTLHVSRENARRMLSRVGLVTQGKIEEMVRILETNPSPEPDFVPDLDVSDLCVELRAQGLRVNLWPRMGRHPSYQDLRALLRSAREAEIPEDRPAHGRVAALVARHWFYDPVVLLQEGRAEVYDIEVGDPRHAFVGNGLINHNTITSIAACCYVWGKTPNQKVIILTTKSVLGQWALEFEKFCVEGTINVLPCMGTPAERQRVYKEFEHATGPTVLILGYATARRDFKFIQSWSSFVLIADEASAFKNPSTQTYQVVRHLSAVDRATRFWALTATPIKNSLMEGYGIYSLVVPNLFPASKNRFMSEYCLTRLQKISNSRQIPVVIGYRKDQIERFREKIDPYFLARAKFDVAKELPALVLREHKCGMSSAQEAKYREALAGLLEKDKTNEEVETTKLTALIYCQQIVDHPGLVDCEGDSDKMDELFDLLTEGDLAEEKIIVFTRFRKMVDRLEQEVLERKLKIETVRVTGAEDEEERKRAMQRFQDPNSGVRVCWITEAAKEGINLQAAKALIFYDTPWSAGDYLQVLGRMIRIGSKHDRCYAIHLVARGTIDARVMGVLRKKMHLIEQVMGKRIKGEGMEDFDLAEGNTIDDLFLALQQDARAA